MELEIIRKGDGTKKVSRAFIVEGKYVFGDGPGLCARLECPLFH